ncbi:ABC transporter [Schaalia sp. Marseille-Q2122]|uniref:ABC transporter n=1 Tax=Schaalia sp. Marseille-Q2122 TaxID=2736604 RepID=UPI00158A102A|nr:ABC transporter [Schaalia sp. Marseille-Q2122]
MLAARPSEAQRQDPSRDEGSEVVSHILVQFLVLLVVMILLQSAILVHTRNTTISAAGEGARRAALLGGNSAEAQHRVEALLESLLGHDPGRSVVLSTRPDPAGAVAVVTVRTTLPVFFTLGPPLLEVQGSAVMEAP